ncbi:response regulator transcription factor [candidate division KSB1 bacterium]|nr:response regulator transcription factor [candidate division KSB1 bacterium]
MLVPIYFALLRAYAGQPNPWVDLLALPLYDLPVLIILAQNLRSGSRVEEQSIVENSNAQLLQRYAITPRESQIIRLICAGKSNREIASELYISLQTAKDHAYNIYRKTGVKNRVQLCNLFRENPESEIHDPRIG